MHKGRLVKFALVHLGNEESYGLLFAASDLKKYGEIKFFDGGFGNPYPEILEYKPDYLCFSPMTEFYPSAKKIETEVKARSEVTTIYGGHHAANCGTSCGDLTVTGSSKNLDLSKRGIVHTEPVLAKDLGVPAREEYYRDIPRMKERYRKIMLSVVGCPFQCTYCSSKHSDLGHRDMDSVFREAEFIRDCTHEIEWVDDDVFAGNEDWLLEFFGRWEKEIGIPLYVSTTSINALRASRKLLHAMKPSVHCIGMGMQAARPQSLKLLGRSWDSRFNVENAYERLVEYGFRVNLQAIIGLPVEDPIGDALDTIMALTEIAQGSVVSVYPLQIYPNTAMARYCAMNNIALNQESGDTNTGIPGIHFGEFNNRRIQNLCKLATMAVKYGISRQWLEALLDVNLGLCSKKLSEIRYFECIRDRNPENADEIFRNVFKTMKLRY